MSPSDDQSNGDNVAALLAKELNQLSFDDRNKIQEEVHGVQSVAIEETPQTIDRSLIALEVEIANNVAIEKKTAYEFARTVLRSDYVQDRDFLLKFLRADLFDVKKAAVRLTTHLEMLHKYFGPDALKRPLQYSDLSKIEQDVFRAGYNQVLPSRDRSGRLVAFLKGFKKEHSMATRIRLLLYIYCAISEDTETQKKGLVCVYVPNLEALVYLADKEVQKDYKVVVSSFPVRWSGLHFCFPDTPMYRIIGAIIVVVFMGTDERVRMKTYTGLTMETQYQLMGYGISTHDLPITSSGSLKTKTHHQWIKTRKAIDQVRLAGHYNSFTGIVHPGVFDVLFSRGGNPSHHGNRELHQAIGQRIPAFTASTSRKVKKDLRDEVIGLVRSRNGRFLQLNHNGWWEEIQDMNIIHEKISAAVYENIRKAAAMKNQQQNKSDTDQFLPPNIKRRKLDADSFCSL